MSLYQCEQSGVSGNRRDFEILMSRLMSDPIWDSFVEDHPHGHYSQTSLWARVKAIQGWQPVRVLAKMGNRIVAGAQMLVKSAPIAGKVGAVWRGPLFSDDRPDLGKAVLEGMIGACKCSGIRFLALSLPFEDVHLVQAARKFGFNENLLGDIDSRCEIVVDLSPGLEDILARMSSKRRKIIRWADKRGIEIREGAAEDINTFYKLHLISAKRQGFIPYPKKFYQRLWQVFSPSQRVKLFIAEYEGQPVSAQVTILFGDTANAYKIGWNRQHANLYPNDKLDWHTMCWAKAQGYRWYNFMGIEIPVAEALCKGLPVPHDHKYTYSQYKLNFGGQPVFYPPSYERVFIPGEKWLYRVIFYRLSKNAIISRLVQRLVKRTVGCAKSV